MMKRILKFSFSISFLLLMAFFLYLGFYVGQKYVISQNERFSRYDKAVDSDTDDTNDSNGKGEDKAVHIDENYPGAIMIYVNIGDTTDQIAAQLVEKKVISHPVLFKMISKLNGFDGGYQYGTHFVTKDMPYDEIMFNLTGKPATKQILFREGLSNKELKTVMKENGIILDENYFDDICANPSKYGLDFPFLKDIRFNKDRKSILEGYLFPDTYTFDLNTDPKKIIYTMLSNFNNQILPEQYERAKKMMSWDDIIILASIIEKEAGNQQEMYKISRVFHNRLLKKMPLQSCATVNYIRQQNNLPPVLIVSEQDLQNPDPYNTYKINGLPPGPICNPGLEAIRAALYPDTQNKDLLFFSATGTGNNVFASTFEEHLNNINKYLLPLAKEKGFAGSVSNDEKTVYSSGGDITALN